MVPLATSKTARSKHTVVSVLEDGGIIELTQMLPPSYLTFREGLWLLHQRREGSCLIAPRNIAASRLSSATELFE